MDEDLTGDARITALETTLILMLKRMPGADGAKVIDDLDLLLQGTRRDPETSALTTHSLQRLRRLLAQAVGAPPRL